MPKYLDFVDGQVAQMPNGPIRAALAQVAKAHREIDVAKANLAGNADLSVQGKTNEARSQFKKRAFELVKANLTAQRLNTRLEEKRAAIKLPEIDKTDAAGAVLRSQVRDRLTGKSAKEIRASIPTMSALYLQAILEAPELVGIDRDTADIVRSRAIDLVHPGKLAELDAERDAVRLIQNATNALAEAAREFVDLPNQAALRDFIDQAVPDQRHIAADVERETAPLAAA